MTPDPLYKSISIKCKSVCPLIYKFFKACKLEIERIVCLSACIETTFLCHLFVIKNDGIRASDFSNISNDDNKLFDRFKSYTTLEPKQLKLTERQKVGNSQQSSVSVGSDTMGTKQWLVITRSALIVCDCVPPRVRLCVRACLCVCDATSLTLL